MSFCLARRPEKHVYALGRVKAYGESHRARTTRRASWQ